MPQHPEQIMSEEQTLKPETIKAFAEIAKAVGATEFTITATREKPPMPEEDPTQFTTRSFAVIWNEGHSIRLINRENPRWAISIPWDELDALRAILSPSESSRQPLSEEQIRTVVERFIREEDELAADAPLGYWAQQLVDRITAELLKVSREGK